jgi:hypothetical protein
MTVKKMHKMKMTKLTEINLPYNPDEFNGWIERDFSVIDERIPIHVRDFIKKKALNRKGKQKVRLFSEIMALNQYIDYAEDRIIWYSSFKWLSASKWYLGGINDELERKFFKDINRYFKFNGIPIKNVEYIQKNAMEFKKRDRGELLGLTKSGKIKNPTSPDIWLKHKDHGIIFVEAKRDETLEPTQLAGIALIKKYLNLDTHVVRFYPNTVSERPMPIDHTDEYMKFLNSV